MISKYEENSRIYAENKTEMEEDCCSGDDADPASRVYRGTSFNTIAILSFEWYFNHRDW